MTFNYEWGVFKERRIKRGDWGKRGREKGGSFYWGTRNQRGLKFGRFAAMSQRVGCLGLVFKGGKTPAWAEVTKGRYQGGRESERNKRTNLGSAGKSEREEYSNRK